MPETIYRTGIYVRLSREDNEKGESNSMKSQKAICMAYISSHPDLNLVEVYDEDDGYTGTNMERPGIQRMLKDMRTGRINCAISKDLSRFSRNYIDAGKYLEKIFPSLGIRYIAVNDCYDSLTSRSASDAVTLSFKNLFNDFYSRDLSVKIRSQFEIKRKKGEFIGSFVSYGYKKEPNNKNHLQIDEDAASVVRNIFRWRMSGMSNEKIADKLNKLGVLSPAEYKRSQGMNYQCGFCTDKPSKWSPVSIGRILSNQTYLGWVVQGKRTTPNYKIKKVIQKNPEEWEIVKDMHDAVISEDDFLTVQNLVKRNIRTSPGKEYANLFSGIAECGDCHRRMNRKLVSAGKNTQGKIRKYPYYICSANKKDKTVCSSHMISEKELEKAVLSIINFHILGIKELKDILSVLKKTPQLKDETKKLDIQQLKINEEIVKLKNINFSLYKDLKEGVIDKKEYIELKQIYREQADELEKKKVCLRKEQELYDWECFQNNKWMEHFLQYQDFPFLSRSLLLKLVKKITVLEKNRIKIVFCFKMNYPV